MTGGIYSIDSKGRLMPMTEQPYASEDLLQDLLATHPDLLAGDQMDVEAPRRWLLVGRELGLASEEEGSERWSVDHLFLDQDAVPTIVEVKRSTDTRIRREVIGQMLEYAANAVVYWPVETLRARFEASRDNPEDELRERLGTPDADPEEFWERARTNLQAGKVRMVFAADEIPTDLRRVVEFLNEQMDPAQVLAVEIKQYAGEGTRTLIPRVVGGSTGARTNRSGATTRPTKQWDETSFLSLTDEALSSTDARVVRKLYEWVKDRDLRVSWGRGFYTVSFNAFVGHGETWCKLIAPWVSDSQAAIEISFEYLKEKPPFNERSKRLELLEKLNGISGVDISPERVDKRPSVPAHALRDEAALGQFLETLDWAVVEVGATRPASG